MSKKINSVLLFKCTLTTIVINFPNKCGLRRWINIIFLGLQNRLQFSLFDEGLQNTETTAKKAWAKLMSSIKNILY